MKCIAFSIAAIVALVLSSCVGVSNVSHRAPFNDVVGKELRTQRATVLRQGLATDTTGEAMVSAGHSVLTLHDATGVWSGNEKKVAEIPAGQPIRIVEVREEMGDGSSSYTVVGDIFVPKTAKFTRFYYYWGGNYGRYGELHRAPWEPESVPRERKI